MGGVVETQLDGAIQAVLRRDPELAEQVVKGDAKVDAIEQEIGELVVRLLALRQPMAVDLRHIVSALKIAADLERIGDYAAKHRQAGDRDQPGAAHRPRPGSTAWRAWCRP